MKARTIIHKIIDGQLDQLVDYIDALEKHEPEIVEDLKDIYDGIKDLRIQLLMKDKEK